MQHQTVSANAAQRRCADAVAAARRHPEDKLWICERTPIGIFRDSGCIKNCSDIIH